MLLEASFVTFDLGQMFVAPRNKKTILAYKLYRRIPILQTKKGCVAERTPTPTEKQPSFLRSLVYLAVKRNALLPYT